MDLRSRKQRLRRHMVVRRRGVEAVAAEEAAGHVASHLAASPELRDCSRVALYASLPDELPSRPLFEAVSRSGRPTLFPRLPAEGVLEFASCARWEELRPGRYGVLEPAVSARTEKLGRGDLVLVPGVAFDPAGNRLGRGRGYYDRGLPAPQGSGPLLVGVGFAFQLVEEVPSGEGDRPMQAILTERGWHRVRALEAR